MTSNLKLCRFDFTFTQRVGDLPRAIALTDQLLHLDVLLVAGIAHYIIHAIRVDLPRAVLVQPPVGNRDRTRYLCKFHFKIYELNDIFTRLKM